MRRSQGSSASRSTSTSRHRPNRLASWSDLPVPGSSASKREHPRVGLVGLGATAAVPPGAGAQCDWGTTTLQVFPDASHGFMNNHDPTDQILLLVVLQRCLGGPVRYGRGAGSAKGNSQVESATLRHNLERAKPSKVCKSQPVSSSHRLIRYSTVFVCRNKLRRAATPEKP